MDKPAALHDEMDYFKLEALPIDLLAIVCDFLEAQTLSVLYVAASAILRISLVHADITTLTLHGKQYLSSKGKFEWRKRSMFWPQKWALNSKIRTVNFNRILEVHRLTCYYLPHSFLDSLPSTLQHLNMKKFSLTLFQNQYPSNPGLSAKFPILLTLSIGDLLEPIQNADKTIADFFQSLPSSLQKLAIYHPATISLETFKLLPPKLTTLKLPNFGDLFFQSNDTTWLQPLQDTLTNLSVYWKTIPIDTQWPKHLSKFSSKITSLSQLKSLPHSVTQLKIRAHLISVEFEQFPRWLKHITIASASIVSSLDHAPSNLESFVIKHDHKFSGQESRLSLLPPTVKKLQFNPPANFLACDLPRHLTQLKIACRNRFLDTEFEILHLPETLMWVTIQLTFNIRAPHSLSRLKHLRSFRSHAIMSDTVMMETPQHLTRLDVGTIELSGQLVSLFLPDMAKKEKAFSGTDKDCLHDVNFDFSRKNLFNHFKSDFLPIYTKLRWIELNYNRLEVGHITHVPATVKKMDPNFKLDLLSTAQLPRWLTCINLPYTIHQDHFLDLPTSLTRLNATGQVSAKQLLSMLPLLPNLKRIKFLTVKNDFSIEDLKSQVRESDTVVTFPEYLGTLAKRLFDHQVDLVTKWSYPAKTSWKHYWSLWPSSTTHLTLSKNAQLIELYLTPNAPIDKSNHLKSLIIEKSMPSLPFLQNYGQNMNQLTYLEMAFDCFYEKELTLPPSLTHIKILRFVGEPGLVIHWPVKLREIQISQYDIVLLLILPQNVESMCLDKLNPVELLGELPNSLTSLKIKQQLNTPIKAQHLPLFPNQLITLSINSPPYRYSLSSVEILQRLKLNRASQN